MPELRFAIPGEDTPGYLKREIRRLEFLAEYEQIVEPVDKTKALAEYLLEFVVEPEDKDAAREMILDAPKSAIDEVMQYAVMGRTAPAVPDPESEGSEAG